MIKFCGCVGKEVRKYMRIRLFFNGLKGAIWCFILLGIPSVFIGIYFDIWFFLIMVSICMIGISSLSCLFVDSTLPLIILIEQGEIYGEYNKGAATRSPDDVKKVIDKGDFYDILFYFPNRWTNCICQKDLIVEGTIEEFEKLFEDKIVRKYKTKD